MSEGHCFKWEAANLPTSAYLDSSSPLGNPQNPRDTQYENPYVTVIVVTLSETHYNRVSQNIVPELLGSSQPTELESLGVQPRNLHLYPASQVILVNSKVREPLDNRVTYSESIFFHYKNNTYTFKT